MPSRPDDGWTYEGDLRHREVIEHDVVPLCSRAWGTTLVPGRLKTKRQVQIRWEFFCYSCGLTDIIWVEEGKNLELSNCTGCGTGSTHWVAKPSTKTAETTIMQNNCDKCGHHRDMHQYGECVECVKLGQNGVCLPMGVCFAFMEPLQMAGMEAAAPPTDLSFEQGLQVGNKIDAAIKPLKSDAEKLKTAVSKAVEMSKTAKEMAASFGVTVATAMKAIQELKPHMDRVKAEHEKRKEFAMTFKGHLATWIKHQPPIKSYARRDAFSNGYRASVECGNITKPGAAWTAYKAWLVRSEIGALSLRWDSWCAGWNIAREHYKYEAAALHDARTIISRLAAQGRPLDGSPIEWIDEDGNSDAKTAIDENGHRILVLEEGPISDLDGDRLNVTILEGGIPTKRQFDERSKVCACADRPTHQEEEESDQSMIPSTVPDDVHKLAERFIAAAEAPWVPKAGEIAYIKETFEGPFVLLERLDEETVITFLNPLQDSADCFVAAKLPVGTKAWLVQPSKGKPRTILEPLLTNQKPPRGQFFSRCAEVISSRFFGHLIQAAGFGTLAYLLLR